MIYPIENESNQDKKVNIESNKDNDRMYRDLIKPSKKEIHNEKVEESSDGLQYFTE